MEFEHIYNTYKNLVYNLALQYVQNAEDAEEITQDVFVTVHEKLKKFRNESNIQTWIYRITINQALDFIKFKKRKKRFAVFVSLFDRETGQEKLGLTDFNHPGVELEHKEEVSILFDSINRLTSNQKTAIILVKIEGHSLKEAGEIMKLSSKAIESLIQRAKSKISIDLNKKRGI